MSYDYVSKYFQEIFCIVKMFQNDKKTLNYTNCK